jgi:hypothetical protein
MGLLDEAIREHLELKRRGGGDPTEIAHQEREALDPVFPEAGAPAGGEHGKAEAPAGGDAAAPATEPPPADADFSSVGQETAELDMQAVLDADGEHDGVAEPAAAAPRTAAGESFEWEAPPAAPQPPAEPDPGQERLSFE